MTELLPEDSSKRETSLVRVEANLEEWPFFSATKRSRRGEVAVWRRVGRDPANHRPVDQVMTLDPSTRFGLPAERERDLYYLVLAPEIEREGFGPNGRIGPIRYHDACKLLGWTRSGKSYQLVRDALRTLASTTVEFSNSIMDGTTRRLFKEVTGPLFTAYQYGEESAGKPGERLVLRRGEFYLEAATWFVKNYEANYTKPIDQVVYRGLRMPLAKALYSYLDKRAWDRRGEQYRPEVNEKLEDLRERFRLGVRLTKNLLQEFRRSHDDLTANWPALQSARIEKISRGRYRAVYVFSNQLPLGLDESARPEERAEQGRVAIIDPPVVQDLRLRGISITQARKLAQEHAEEDIRHHMDIHDRELKTRTDIQNPPGRLYSRITEGWAAPEGYVPPAERKARQARRRAVETKLRDEVEAAERDQQEFDALPPEERARRRADTWFLVFPGKRTDEAWQAKYDEYLRSYQQPATQ